MFKKILAYKNKKDDKPIGFCRPSRRHSSLHACFRKCPKFGSQMIQKFKPIFFLSFAATAHRSSCRSSSFVVIGQDVVLSLHMGVILITLLDLFTKTGLSVSIPLGVRVFAVVGCYWSSPTGIQSVLSTFLTPFQGVMMPGFLAGLHGLVPSFDHLDGLLPSILPLDPRVPPIP